MKKVLNILLFCILLGVNEVLAQNYLPANSYLFSFPENQNFLLVDYGDNAFALQCMNEDLLSVRSKLLDNKSHILIVAHVSAYDYAEGTVINEASLRASRIRAYVKSKLNIPHECVAFYIDKSGTYRDRVDVYLVGSPLPWFVNQEICYSESLYPVAVKDAIKRYGSVPYVDFYSRGSSNGESRIIYVITDELFDDSELEDYRLLIKNKPSVSVTGRVMTENGTPVLKTQTVKPAVKSTTPSVVQKELQTAHYVFPLKFAVKTNLLPWFKIVSSLELGNGNTGIQIGSFMPNLELEYYFADRWSIALAGKYADFSYKGKDDNKWSVSDITLSPKVWPIEKGSFSGLSVGLFGQYGDFDIRGEKISVDGLYGRTGRFWTAGASIGYLIPVYSGFCMEAELQTGYRSVFNGKKYRYDEIDNKNYLETRFSSTGFMVGLKISVLYRFGF